MESLKNGISVQVEGKYSIDTYESVRRCYKEDTGIELVDNAEVGKEYYLIVNNEVVVYWLEKRETSTWLMSEYMGNAKEWKETIKDSDIKLIDGMLVYPEFEEE